jgi:hypothetical protein
VVSDKLLPLEPGASSRNLARCSYPVLFATANAIKASIATCAGELINVLAKEGRLRLAFGRTLLWMAARYHADPADMSRLFS